MPTPSPIGANTVIHTNATIRTSILQQAWPILISQWAGVSFAVLDTMMLGNHSPESLQTMSLAASIFITVNISLTGVIHALIPIFSQLIGSKKYHQVGELWGQGIWLGMLLALIAGLLLLFPNLWLSISGDVPEHVRQQVATYLRIVYFSMPAALMFRAIYSICTSAQRPKHVMYISVTGIFIKAALNWVLIFGYFGLPALGSTGAGISTTVVSWLMFAFGLWVLFSDPYYQKFKLSLGRPQWRHFSEILKLGIPMGGSYFVEVSAFTFMALLAAREGTHVSGAHQIMANLAAVLYMMPMSFGIATSSLAAQAIGARNLLISHRIIKIGFMIMLCGALLSSLLVFFGKHTIIGFYTSDTQVALMAASLLTIAPFFHILDSYQCMNTYVLRAHKIATIPFLIQTFMLTGIGLGGGFYFGYGPGQGALSWISQIVTPGAATGVSSLWIMCCIALTLCGIILHFWYRKIIYKPLIAPLVRA